MKRVVSVSLGTRKRDHDAMLTILGTPVQVSRRGTDGSLEAAARLIGELADSGTVDVLGLGGIDRYLVVGDRRYEIADARRLATAAGAVPVVDGSGIKAAWEPRVVEMLLAQGRIRHTDRVLMVSALDRFGMAQAFFRLGFSTVCGDLIFASRINYPIRTLSELEEMGRKLLPTMVSLPFHQLYPVGDDQEAFPDERYAAYFSQADIIAGDFHFIRRFLPPSLNGKTVITNTTTQRDRELLKARGVTLLVTTTPVLEGRSFGTNVVEAAVVAVTGLSADDPGWDQAVAASGLGLHVWDWQGGPG